MNYIHKSACNSSLGEWVAIREIGSDKGKHKATVIKCAAVLALGCGVASLCSVSQAQSGTPEIPQNFPVKEAFPDIDAIINNPAYTDGWDTVKNRWNVAANAALDDHKFINNQELKRTWAASSTQIVYLTKNSHIINSTIDSVQVTLGSLAEDAGSTAIGNTVKGGIDGRGGYLQLNSGTKAYDTVVENLGSLSTNSGSQAYNTLVKTGGRQTVGNNSYVQANIIDGGVQTIAVTSNNGIAEDNLIINGGQQIIYAGQAKNSHIGNGSYQLASGLAIDTKVYDGGYQDVYSGQSATSLAAQDTTIYSGGTQRIRQGVADRSIIYGEQIITNKDGSWENGVWVDAPSGTWGSSPAATNTTVEAQGIQRIELNGTARDTTLKSGTQYIEAYGHAYNTTVDGGLQVVKAYGHAEDAMIKNNGTTRIEFGGYAFGTIEVEDGVLTMQGGDLHDWTENLGKGAYAQNVVLNGMKAKLLIQANSQTSESTVTIDSLSSDRGQTVFEGEGVSGSPVYSQLALNKLSGNGQFEMRTDLVAGTGDLISIQKSSTGKHDLHFNDGNSGSYVGNEKLKVVEFNGNSADNTAVFDGKADAGAFVYSVYKDGENWFLGSAQAASPNPDPVPTPDPGKNPDNRPPLTNLAQYSAGILSTNYLMSYVETQTLLQRMGDLRTSQGKGGVWGRVYAGSVDGFGDRRIANYDMDYTGMQIGVDRQFEMTDHGTVFVGVAGGYGQGKVDYPIGNGKTDSYHLGAYVTYQADNRFYVDGFLKYTRMKNEIDTLTSNGYAVNGKGNTSGVSLGVEVGKRFYFNPQQEGFFIEPQGQVTIGQQDGASIKGSNGLRTDLSRYTSVLGRGSVLLGYSINKGQNITHVYFKTGIVKEFDGKTAYTFNSTYKERYDFGGSWWDNGIGVDAQIGKRHHIYAQASYAKGGRFDHKQFNLGYRLSF